MENKIITTIVIIVVVMLGLCAIYNNMPSKNSITYEDDSISNTIKEISGESPKVEYVVSSDQQARIDRITENKKKIDINYANQEENVKKIISLCMSGNIGACNVLNEDYNIKI
jgi:hypothetical protein